MLLNIVFIVSLTIQRIMGSQKPENLNSNNSTRTLPKPYGNVELSLNNVLLPEEKLNPTPSKEDGMDAETETSLRILGCELIQTAGILLKLPQVTQIVIPQFVYHAVLFISGYNI